MTIKNTELNEITPEQEAGAEQMLEWYKNLDENEQENFLDEMLGLLTAFEKMQKNEK